MQLAVENSIARLSDRNHTIGEDIAPNPRTFASVVELVHEWDVMEQSH